MAKLKWDATGERLYETGVSNCALYVQDASGKYPKGVAWNGVTAITESPSGAEETPLYADNIKYLSLTSAEEFGATIEAYSSPEEFDECDGTVSPIEGVSFGQQDRKQFGLAYKTILGNDIKKNNYGYKIHIIYGASAAPSEKGYNTVNDSPDATALSWELTTTPVEVNGYKPTATIVIDSTKISAGKLKKIEDTLFGTDSGADEPKLPLPDEIITMLNAVEE